MAAHYPLATVVSLAGETFEAIRERVGQIPTRLELSDDGADFIATATAEIDNAMEAIHGRVHDDNAHART